MMQRVDIAHRLLLAACLALCAFFFLSFSYTAITTLTYPFHLEWMEGHVIDTIQRVTEGKPVYDAPKIDYVPFLYTPLYYYVSALVALLTGIDFFPARLVSLLCTFGSCGILYGWLRKEGASRLVSLLAPGLFLATYPLSGRWFDVARVDSLFLFLTLAGLFVFIHYRGTKAALLAAALMAAAVFTKQIALLIFAPVLLAGLWTDARKALTTGGVLAILVGVGIALFQSLSDSWFWFYIYEVPAGHRWNEKALWRFWTRDLIKPLWLLCLAAPAVLWLFAKQDKQKLTLYAALLIGFIGASYTARLHSYSYLNVLMPTHAVLALFAVLTFTKLPVQKGWLRPACLLLVAIQLVLLVYNPLRFIPTPQSMERGISFLNRIAKIEGDVFIPELQFVQTRVGKKSYAYGMAAFDVIRSNLGKKDYIAKDLTYQLGKAMREQQFTAVVPGRIFNLLEKQGIYTIRKPLNYPREHVTGALRSMRMRLYFAKPSLQQLPGRQNDRQ